MWDYGITLSQHCKHEINYNDDNVMRENVWFAFLVDYFTIKTHDIWEENGLTRSEIWIKNFWSLVFWDTVAP